MLNNLNKSVSRNLDYPIGLFSHTNSKFLEESHHHIEYELLFIEKGSVNCTIDNVEYGLTAGNACFFAPGVNHYGKTIKDDEPFKYYAFIFDLSILGDENDLIRRNFAKIRIPQFVSLSDTLIDKIKEIEKIEDDRDFSKMLMEKALVFDLINHLIKTHQYVEITNENLNFESNKINAINTATKYIKAHYRENISLEDVLRITSYSKSHFIRLFKKNTGMSFTQYINKFRIEKACIDLLYTQKNITEVAMENGFNNVQYFSKIFKEYMNCTPKKYQFNGRNIITHQSRGTE